MTRARLRLLLVIREDATARNLDASRNTVNAIRFFFLCPPEWNHSLISSLGGCLASVLCRVVSDAPLIVGVKGVRTHLEEKTVSTYFSVYYQSMA